jgi:hypothetical protein
MDESSVSTISTYNGSNLISAYDTDVKIKDVNDYKMSYNTNFEENNYKDNFNNYKNDNKKDENDIDINTNNGCSIHKDLINEDLSTDIYKKMVLDNYLNNERMYSAVYNSKISDAKYVNDESDGNNSLNGGGMISERNVLLSNDDDALKQIFGSDSDDDYDDMKFDNNTDKRAYESTDNQNYQPTNSADRILNLDHDPHGSYLRSKDTYKNTNHLNTGHKSDKFIINFDDDFNDIFGSSRSASPSPDSMK